MGMQEILVVALLFLVLFGIKRVPELMKGVGRGIREFKQGIKDDDPS